MNPAFLRIRQLCHGMAKTQTVDGALARIYVLLLELEFKGKLDLKKCALDSSFVRTKKGGDGSAKPVEAQPVSVMPS